MTCVQCKSGYVFREGIYDLRCKRRDYYFNPVPREEMAVLVRNAADRPWDDSVRHFLRHVKNIRDWIDNIVVNGRYTWKLFLDLPAGSRFLDFGCGLGNLTSNLAPHVGEVVALDLTWERLQFAKERFAKVNPRDRISLVAAGDGPHLPFPDSHFDCIALSGVLEWIADDFDVDAPGSRVSKALRMLMSFFGESNPRRTQLRFLKELRRVLKPGGQLFVAIENRWNHEYFAGRPDHHSALRYAALLPRFAANVYSIARSHRPYRTYTHSLPGFRKLFAAAGFAYQEFYGLSPGYSGLREIIPAGTDQPFWKADRPAALGERARRSRYFVPAFGIVARDHVQPSPALLGRILGEIEHALTAGPIALRDCIVSGKDKAVLRGTIGEVPIVIKLPADQRAYAGEENNWRTLTALRHRAELADLVPKPLARGVYQGAAYYAESAVRGRPLGDQPQSLSRDTAAGIVSALLAKLHSQPNETAELTHDSEPYRALIAEPMARLTQSGADPARCDVLEQRLRAALAGRRWQIGLCHGDFSRSNIFVADDEISGIIDWEYSTERGLPVLDAMSYVESMQRVAEPASTVAENLLRLSRWEWPSAAETAFLRALYRRFEIDPATHAGLCLLCCLQHVAHQLDTAARFDNELVDRYLGPLLEAPLPPC